MNPIVGWTLAVVCVVLAYRQWGWQGSALGVTLVVFWLLLQFSRALRALRKAGGAPVGSVPSAVMLHSRLREGMTLVQVLSLTGSLGERVTPPQEGAEESWCWRDDGAVVVTVGLRSGRVRHWALHRPA